MKIHLVEFKKIAIFILVLCVVFVIYYQSIDGPFLFDDAANIIDPLNNIKSGAIGYKEFVFGNHSGRFGRVIPMATFAIDYKIYGIDEYGFKLTNIVIHIVCGLVIFFLAKLLVKEVLLERSPQKIYWCAVFVSAMWLIAPMFVSTVLYVVQRMAQLSTLIQLIGLIFFIKFRLKMDESSLRDYFFLLIIIYGFTGFGLFAKENAIVFPFLCISFEWLIDKNHNKKNIIIFYLTFAFLPAFLGAFYLLNSGYVDFSGRNFTMIERLYSESRIVWGYFFNLILPRGAYFGLYHDDMEISKGLLNPISTFYSVLGWVGVFVLLIISAYKKTKLLRIVSFGFSFFIAGHILESGFINLELIFEHRNYLPAVGLYITIGLLLLCFLEKKPNFLKSAVFFVCVYMLIVAIALMQRVLAWGSVQNIVYSTLLAHPQSVRALADAAQMDAILGRYENAYASINKIHEMGDEYAIPATLQKIYTGCKDGSQNINTYFSGLGKVNVPSSAIFSSNILLAIKSLSIKGDCKNLNANKLLEIMISLYDKKYNEAIDTQDDNLARRLKLQIPVYRSIIEFSNGIGDINLSIKMWVLVDRMGIRSVPIDLMAANAFYAGGLFDESRKLLLNLEGTQDPDLVYYKKQINVLKNRFNNDGTK